MPMVMRRGFANIHSQKLVQLIIPIRMFGLLIRQSGPTSFDQQLNVSISLAAHMRVPCALHIHPPCEILQPQFPTWSTASSSSASRAFEVLTSPSDEVDSSTLLGSDVCSLFKKCTAVISSEWVEPWERSRAAGFRGSLEKKGTTSEVFVGRRELNTGLTSR